MKSTKMKKDADGFSSRDIINYLAIFAFCFLLLMSFIQGVQGSQPISKGKSKTDRISFQSEPYLANVNDEYGNLGPGVGNIGCLFSKSVCDDKAEWCFDDYAFGRCLPSHEVVDEPKLYRYELSKSDTHTLEKEMERLFALGYRWRHSYTQCVLQNMLEAQRRGSEWEQAVCSEEVDQDLEGALKAFADEIDPWNLAFVKFTPSKINPHANFADEMYRPPAQLPEIGIDIPPKVVGGHDANQKAPLNSHSRYKQPVLELTAPEERILEEALEDYVEDELPIDSIPSWKDKKSASPLRMRAGVTHEKRTKGLTADDWKREVEREVTDEALVDQQVGGEAVREDFGVGPGGVVDESILQPRIFSSLYNTPDLFRRGVELKDELAPSNGLGDVSAEGDGGAKFRQDDNDVRKEQEELLILEQLALLAKAEEEQGLLAGDGSVGAELQFGFPLRQSLRADHNHRNSLDVEEERASTIPEFLPVPAAALGSLSASVEDSNPHYTEGGLVFLKSDDTPEFIFDDDDLGSIGSPTNSQKKGNFLKRFFLGVDGDEDNGEEAEMGEPDLSRNGAFELSYGYGYGGGLNGPQRAFERRERLDVKKPGPWYRTVNNFAFDNKQDQMDGREMTPQKDNSQNSEFIDEGPASLISSEHQEDSQLESDLVSQSHSKDNSEGASNSNVETNQQGTSKDKKYRQPKSTSVDYGGVVNKKSAPVNFKSGLPETLIPKNNEHLDVIDTSYVYIVINKVISWNGAKDLVATISDVLDVKRRAFSDIRVSQSGKIVTFKVGANEKLWNASEVANRLEHLNENDAQEIAREDGIRIERANVGVTTNNKGPAATLLDGDAIANNNLFITTFAVCGFVAAILVAAVSLFLIRKHAKTRQKIARLADDDPSFEACKDYQDLCRARMAGSKNNEKVEPLKGATQRVATAVSRDSENGTNSSRSSTSSWTEEPVLTNMDISTGHMVLSYMEDHLKKRDRLDQEWAGLCSYEADPCSTTISEKPENSKKNRYSNSLPYDHSRVILNDLANINGLDYINASTITDHDPRNPAYIATQGPLAHTAADFWQMVWEQGSVVIVTLTRLADNGTPLCHRYWPEEGSELHHIYEVHLVSEHIWCDEYLVRSFYLKNLKTGETRTVTQFHFQAWLENSIPQSTKAILEFRRKVNKSYRGRSCPIIVHCSDGAGRTGTYCLIDMVLNRMAKGAKEIDIAASLEHIRDQRPGMVRTKQQFEFVLMAVAEEVHAILKALPQ